MEQNILDAIFSFCGASGNARVREPVVGRLWSPPGRPVVWGSTGRCGRLLFPIPLSPSTYLGRHRARYIHTVGGPEFEERSRTGALSTRPINENRVCARPVQGPFQCGGGLSSDIQSHPLVAWEPHGQAL